MNCVVKKLRLIDFDRHRFIVFACIPVFFNRRRFYLNTFNKQHGNEDFTGAILFCKNHSASISIYYVGLYNSVMPTGIDFIITLSSNKTAMRITLVEILFFENHTT